MADPAALDLIVGGFVGTAVMSMMMMIGKMLGMAPEDWDMMKDGMGAKMKEMMGAPEWMAYVVHFMLGAIIFPFAYWYVWVDTLGIDLNNYINAVIFILIFGAMMILMFGFLGAPSEWRMKMAMGVVMGHVLYGLILAFFIEQAYF